MGEGERVGQEVVGSWGLGVLKKSEGEIVARGIGMQGCVEGGGLCGSDCGWLGEGGGVCGGVG